MFFLLDISESFNVNTLLFGDEDKTFLLSVLFRSAVMFLVVLGSLRLLGKRGVKQLSVFELVIILTLGSASGDPMFYNDVGLLTAFIVFVTVVSLYRLIVWLADKSSRFNRLVEGKPVCLISDGIFCYQNFLREPIGLDEFFSELRLEHVSQLGQIRRAYLETSGEISIYFYRDENVRYGLPILPEDLKRHKDHISGGGYHSCVHCAYTHPPEADPVTKCPTCSRQKWIPSCKDTRIS